MIVENYSLDFPNIAKSKSNTTLVKRTLSLVFLLFVLSVAARAQHPVGYGSLRSTSQMGSFSFSQLDRGIVKEKTASFFAERQDSITFDVLVTPSGDVKYVRSPKLGEGMYELRLACTSALYGFQFEPIAAESGEKWFRARLIFN